VCSAVYDALLVVWVDAGIERARALSARMCTLPCTTRFGWCRWTPVLSAHEHERAMCVLPCMYLRSYICVFRVTSTLYHAYMTHAHIRTHNAKNDVQTLSWGS
jgi:hypothetical protein